RSLSASFSAFCAAVRAFGAAEGATEGEEVRVPGGGLRGGGAAGGGFFSCAEAGAGKRASERLRRGRGAHRGRSRFKAKASFDRRGAFYHVLSRDSILFQSRSVLGIPPLRIGAPGVALGRIEVEIGIALAAPAGHGVVQGHVLIELFEI